MASSLVNYILSINKAPSTDVSFYLYYPIVTHIHANCAIFQRSVHWMIAKVCQLTLDLKLFSWMMQYY